MIFLDCYRAGSANSLKLERRAVVYKSARAARGVISKYADTIESRRMICEDDVADEILERIDADGAWDGGAHVVDRRG